MDTDGDFVVAWSSLLGQEDVYAQRYNSAGVKQGGEFRVNTVTTGDQQNPSVAMDSDGDFVITWESRGQDGNGFGVYAQRYNSAGVKQGGEFRVNTVTTGRQWYPSVAMDSDGDFSVTWESDGRIYAQRFSAAGMMQGGEFRVDSHTTGTKSAPSIAMDISGGFVITWVNHFPDGDPVSNTGLLAEIFAQRFNASGVKQGEELRVNTLTDGGQWNPDVAMDADGDFAITWYSGTQWFWSSDIFARRYNAAGTPQGDQFRVNTSTTGHQWTPAVAIDSVGNYVITWLSAPFEGGSAQDYGIYARRYNISGSPQGSEFQVGSTAAVNLQSTPAMAMDADGDYVVTWQSWRQDGSGYGVYAQRYDAAGTKRGVEIPVNYYTTNDQSAPAVAMDADGDFVITWHSKEQDGSGYGIYAQRYNASGNPQGLEFRVNSTVTGSQFFPAVAMDVDGDFVVTWQSDGQDGGGYGIYARRYSAAGLPQGGEFRVNTYTTNHQFGAAISMDADGDFIITWASTGQDGSGTGIYAQRYNAAGVSQGGELRVNSYTTSEQWPPSIAVDSTGSFVVTWSSLGQDGSSYGVYAQRYNASGVKQGGEFRVNSYTNSSQRHSAIAMSANGGDFVISWQSSSQDGSGDGVYAQRYTSVGTKVGGEIRVNTYTTNSQNSPTIAMDVDGDFVIAWDSSGQEGNSSGIYSQRFRVSQLDYLGVWRSGKFYLDSNRSDSWSGETLDTLNAFGAVTDKPLVGDWNGDGYSDIGVWRNGTFYLDANGNGRWDGTQIDMQFIFGNSTDTPIVGDWNKDGKDEIGVWRAGKFYLDLNGNRALEAAPVDGIFAFGAVTDKPIIGDWNADGIDDLGVWRNGYFYLDLNGNRAWNSGVDGVYGFGSVGDTPVVGDWTDDGRDDLGVWRNGKFYLDFDGDRILNAGDDVISFGSTTDVPLIGYWRPKSLPGTPPSMPLSLETTQTTSVKALPLNTSREYPELATLMATPAKRRLFSENT